MLKLRKKPNIYQSLPTFPANTNPKKIWHQIKKTGGATWYPNNGLSDIPFKAAMEVANHLYSMRGDVQNDRSRENYLHRLELILREKISNNKDLKLEERNIHSRIEDDHLWKEYTNTLLELLFESLGKIALTVAVYDEDVMLYIKDWSRSA